MILLILRQLYGNGDDRHGHVRSTTTTIVLPMLLLMVSLVFGGITALESADNDKQHHQQHLQQQQQQPPPPTGPVYQSHHPFGVNDHFAADDLSLSFSSSSFGRSPMSSAQTEQPQFGTSWPTSSSSSPTSLDRWQSPASRLHTHHHHHQVPAAAAVFSPQHYNQRQVQVDETMLPVLLAVNRSLLDIAPAAATATSNTLATSIELSWDTFVTLILPYSIIFVLSIVGNLLVIITLSLNRSMRSVTNIFLLNLAISDLLLGVFAMPFTLVGVLLRRFIFGAFMCHLISYLQTVSVAVSVWTLVAMSVERYYAICQPLRSREHRQTLQHAYRMLALVWAGALILMSPTAIVTQLQAIPQTNNFKCREVWPSFRLKELFTIFLDLSLLIVPLVIMILTYTSIAVTLRHNLHHNKSYDRQKRRVSAKKSTAKKSSKPEADIGVSGGEVSIPLKATEHLTVPGADLTRATSASPIEPPRLMLPNIETQCSVSTNSSCVAVSALPAVATSTTGRKTSEVVTTAIVTANNDDDDSSRHMLRISSSLCTVQARQRRVIIMLCVVVIEFFICWTPVFIMDTLALYQPTLVYGTNRNIARWLGIDIISLCHLLCFSSSCTNPVTYCFMNRRFRRHFCALFRCKTRTTATTNVASSRMITGFGHGGNHDNSSFGHHHHQPQHHLQQQQQQQQPNEQQQQQQQQQQCSVHINNNSVSFDTRQDSSSSRNTIPLKSLISSRNNNNNNNNHHSKSFSFTANKRK